ncbi:hypothetical protein SNEBB_011421 [Seison nebaliae]|nr:hypothetical protein SNEBB_011421 [Seison nebaliae]
MLTTILVTIIVALVVIHLTYYFRRRNSLTSIGLPFPANSSFFFGSSLEIKRLNVFRFLEKYTKQFGDAWSYASGPNNIIVLSDPDSVQEAFIKRSMEFNARVQYPLLDEPEERNVFDSHGKRWKDLRKLLGRAFTAKKMRALNDGMTSSIFNCIDVLEEKSKENHDIDIYLSFKRMTLEVIESCGFGLKSNYHYSNNTQYFKELEFAMSINYMIDVLIYVSCFTFWLMDHMRFLMRYYIRNFSAMNVLIEKLEEDSQKNLLTSIMSSADEDDDLMTENGIVNNLFLFILAGYETTSTALAYAIHALVSDLEIQTKLRNELFEFIENESNSQIDKDTFNFDNINLLPYLDAVVKEVFRFRPIAPLLITRRNLVDTQLDVGKGKIIDIPANTVIMANVMNLHFNPNLWAPGDPSQFIPERHLDDISRHPAANAAFGIGPRSCLGKRFALMEFKITLAYLVSQYEFCGGKNFEENMEIRYGIVNIPKNGIFVKLKKLSKY